MGPGGPQIFYNATNPTIMAYLAQPSVKTGDIWTNPVNTGNTSLGLTGEVTLKFMGIEEVTVPAGTYTAMLIETSSNILRIHTDGTSLLTSLDGITLQMNGTHMLSKAPAA